MLLATVLGLDAKTWEAEDIPMVHLTDARRYVCDPDEILSQTERDSIDSYLLRLDKQCGVESVFVIVKRVSNGDTFRFAQDLGNRQGVGSKKTNRGLVVVVAVVLPHAGDRDAVKSGGIIADLIESILQVINTGVVPKFPAAVQKLEAIRGLAVLN